MAYGMEKANAANTYGLTASAQANVTPKRDTLQSIIENFDPLLNRMDAIISRTMSCADRITGSRPQASGTAEKNPEPNHLIWAVQARRDRLQRIVEMLEEEVTRIEGGLA